MAISDQTSQVFPKTLYHYTTQQGLIGILESKSLYATHIRYLNDAQEFGYALSFVRDYLAPRKKIGTPAAQKFANEVSESLEIVEVVAPYITSFCRCGDRLSQWRGYCRDNSGVALGFSSDGLKTLAQKNRFRFVRCIYEREEQMKLISERYETYVSQEVKPGGDLISEFLAELIADLGTIKETSFEEEHEYRLISTGETKVDYRPGKSFLVPFMRFGLTGEGIQIPLSSVIVGPGPQVELFEKSVQDMLARQLNFHVSVRRSSIPYRDW